MICVTETPSAPAKSTAARRGRPRSEASHQAVMEATARLLDVEELPYEELTVERIAAEAGVGKQTIYRWWENKAAVVLEALVTGYLRLDFHQVPDTGDLRADLDSWVEQSVKGMRKQDEDEGMVILCSLMAAIVSGGEAIQELLQNTDVWSGMHLAERLRSAHAAGELRPDVDPSMVASAVMGTVVMQMLTTGTPDGEWLKKLLHVLLDGALDARRPA
ncbi:TetR/AcrR family transcriptional regulator [Nesterenkonia lacusekhoensis]